MAQKRYPTSLGASTKTPTLKAFLNPPSLYHDFSYTAHNQQLSTWHLTSFHFILYTYMPDASPYGHIFGFRMSRNTGKEEKQRGRGQRWERKISETGMLIRTFLTSMFCIFRQSTGQKWVIESGARPNGDASATNSCHADALEFWANICHFLYDYCMKERGEGTRPKPITFRMAIAGNTGQPMTLNALFFKTINGFECYKFWVDPSWKMPKFGCAGKWQQKNPPCVWHKKIAFSIPQIPGRRPHLVGKFLGFKISKSRGGEGKLRQKKADKRKKRKLGNMKNPHLFGGGFSWPILTKELWKTWFFWPESATSWGLPHVKNVHVRVRILEVPAFRVPQLHHIHLFHTYWRLSSSQGFVLLLYTARRRAFRHDSVRWVSRTHLFEHVQVGENLGLVRFSTLQGLQKCCREMFSWNRAWILPWKMPWNFRWNFASPRSSRNKARKCPQLFPTNLTPFFTRRLTAANAQFHDVFRSADVCLWCFTHPLKITGQAVCL